jgi:hypothetical protein
MIKEPEKRGILWPGQGIRFAFAGEVEAKTIGASELSEGKNRSPPND